MKLRSKKERRKGVKFRRRRHNLMTPIKRFCTSKKAYDTIEEAEALVEQLQNRLVYFPDSKVPSPYLCRRCDKYHVGHSDKRT